MAEPARHIAMRSVQPVAGLSIVIEGRGNPLQNFMALEAIRSFAPRNKLPIVHILMTPGAFPGGVRIADGPCIASGNCRRMALGTGNILMPPFKGKLRCRVVESREFLPETYRVTTFTSLMFGIRCVLRHPSGELSAMRIFMTAGAFPRCRSIVDA